MQRHAIIIFVQLTRDLQFCILSNESHLSTAIVVWINTCTTTAIVVSSDVAKLLTQVKSRKSRTIDRVKVSVIFIDKQQKIDT